MFISILFTDIFIKSHNGDNYKARGDTSGLFYRLFRCICFTCQKLLSSRGVVYIQWRF